MTTPHLHVGTSGWTYDDWAGRFYPDKVKGAERLSYYATVFDTVEVNATFYRFPGKNMIGSWNKRLAEDFHLVLKGHRRITHYQRLQDFADTLDGFMERARQLHTLRVLLWQLPPSLDKDLERLQGFLEALPDDVRHAVEFRHESWWDDDVADALRQHNAAFVAVSHPELPGDIVDTTDFVYARFHGLGEDLYRYDYSASELQGWADRLRPHLDKEHVYAFFNNDFDANAVFNAQTLRGLLDTG